ncbi:hypothetical protein D3H65_09340 [Paraflavitalea soli]|uniref:DUF1735 domain-containing protein n=1 Tax=Paraflavitalea soli TaxID=2315862 RepID=A0A3B7MRD0_9BACT|nr:hypothetical protein [Paraflavitalea soli]AXY74165.1 hypothetical protein D3H65_09340 [Paraflavitalea soli]
MNNKLFSIILCFLTGCLLASTSCKKDDPTYPDAPKRVYTVNKVPDGTVTFTNSAAGKKNTTGVARVYLNQLYTSDVNVSFTLTGTATAGVDYTPPAPLNVTIPAGSWYAEINIVGLNNPLQTAKKTVIITLTAATEGFEIGLGYANAYGVFTYTINP